MYLDRSTGSASSYSSDCLESEKSWDIPKRSSALPPPDVDSSI